MKPIIRVENLSKRYQLGGEQKPYATLRESLIETAQKPLKMLRGNRAAKEQNSFWALKDINFTVNPGEVVGIIGRNGAGKSTLLKVLSRITDPTHGKIELYGRVGSLLEVGTGFHPELTGRENIFLNGSILGMRREEIQRKFDEIVDFAEVEKFLDTTVKHYSSGMYMRLAFAVAANLEPEILIVDEVLAVGDAEFQKKCLGKMKDVSQHGRTVLFVSHQMSAVAQLCTRAIMMKSGAVVYDGLTADTIGEYLSNNSNSSSYSADESEDKPTQILSAVIVNQEEILTAEFAHDENITLKLKIKNFSSDKSIRCAVGVWDLMDKLITVESIAVTSEVGYQSFKVTIPGNYLAPNKLKFSVSLYRPQNLIELMTEFLFFEILDFGFKSLSNPEDYGLVYLKSKWEEVDG